MPDKTIIAPSGQGPPPPRAGATPPHFGTLVDGIQGGAFRREPLQPGTRVHHYEIVEAIGEGGMSAVYGARHVYLNHRVALKTVSSAGAPREAGTRFLREAETLATIDHPGVIRVYDAGYHADIPYLIIEWLHGQTVKRYLQQRQQLSVERTLDLLEAIGAVLLRQEALGIVHRDIKPGNIYIRDSGQYCLFDYGLVGGIESDAHAFTTVAAGDAVTMTGTVMGTPQYLAPEQAQGLPVDIRTDLYALGLVAWECLTGQRARPGDSVYSLLAATQEPLPSLEPLRPDVPGEVETMLASLAAPEPEHRYASAAAFLEDVQRYRYRGRRPDGAVLGTVFVATPFREAFEPVYDAIQESAFAVRLLARRVDKLVYLDNIWQQIVQEIEHARVVVADFTEAAPGAGPNPNVITEAAHARAIGKPLLVLTQDAPEQLPFDWRHVPVVRYDVSPAGLAALGPKLEAKLRHCLLHADLI